jgi:hypothetical protein
MLFAPLELDPYWKWFLRSSRNWLKRYKQTPEYKYIRWLGEKEMYKHEGGQRVFEYWKKLL